MAPLLFLLPQLPPAMPTSAGAAYFRRRCLLPPLVLVNPDVESELRPEIEAPIDLSVVASYPGLPVGVQIRCRNIYLVAFVDYTQHNVLSKSIRASMSAVRASLSSQALKAGSLTLFQLA